MKKKKKKRRRGRGDQAKRYGTTWNSKVCMNFHALMVISLFPKSRVFWDFFLTLEFLKVILVKP